MIFYIYDKDGNVFQGLTLRKVSFESVVMSLSDKIVGEVLYKDNQLPYTMKEYVMYNGTKYFLKNPPTIVRNGMADDTEHGFTKYSFEFYHPSVQLFSIPFTDIAVDSTQQQYKAEDKTFFWIGTLADFCAKVNKNLEGTIFTCDFAVYDDGTTANSNEMSEVLSFDNVMISDALKTCYDTFKTSYVLEDILPTDSDYDGGKKKFRIRFGKPSREILGKDNQPFVFKFGQGLGLKNNSATPKNNKIITRIAGQGSETNIPYGYPQIVWIGDKTWEYTVNNDPKAKGSYPIYDGIINGKTTRLVKHPYTRKRLMPSVYRKSVFDRIYNKDINKEIPLIDYFDADDSYTNPINSIAPSYESHTFEDIEPSIKGIKYKGTAIDELYEVYPFDDKNPDIIPQWNDKVDAEGNYEQGYFRIVLPKLGFDLYSLAIENQPMTIAVESGECAGCKFEIQVNWEDWKKSFYIEKDGKLVFDDGTKTTADGHVYIPEDSHRDAKKYPLTIESDGVSVIVKKDTETFGTILPNTYQQPKRGDKYVFLGISLPQSYILNKERELDEKMKEYMRENNVYYFEYPLKFDEFFLEQNKDILAQIKTNSLIRFEFAKEVLALSVKQITIKFDENTLPQYDIVLTDDISIVLNSIGQVTQGLSQLGQKVSTMQAYYNKNIFRDMFDKINTKLSKNLDDIAHGEITFDKWIKIRNKFIYDYLLRKDTEDGTSFLTKFMGGIKSTDISSIDEKGSDTFAKGGLLGKGYSLYTDKNGDTYLEIDNAIIRKRFVVNVLDIQKEMFSGGNINLTNANGTIFRVYAFDSDGNNFQKTFAATDESGNTAAVSVTNEGRSRKSSYFKIYFTRSDGQTIVEDLWHNGDMAFVKDINATRESMRAWHRVVVGHGKERLSDGKEYNYIVVSNDNGLIDVTPEDYPTSPIVRGVKAYDDTLPNSLPHIGDKVVQYGSVTEVRRMGLTRFVSDGNGDGGVYVVEGIGKNKGTAAQFKHTFMPIKITPNETEIYSDKIFLAARKDGEVDRAASYEITANGMKQIVTDITNVGSRVSVVEQKADGLTTKVEDNTGAISEINQTATNISIKVNNNGGRNLLVGTKYLSGERIFLEPEADSSAIYKDFISVGMTLLPTPPQIGYKDLFTYIPVMLKPQTVYTLSFMYIGMKGSDFDTYIFGKTDGKLRRVCEYVKSNLDKENRFDEDGRCHFDAEDGGLWKKASIEFKTVKSLSTEEVTETIEATIILGRIYYRKDRENNIYLSAPKLEYGNVATEWRPNDNDTNADLAETGIDIKDKKITLTADNVEVKNNDGNTTVLITADGKLSTELVNAERVVTDALNAKEIVVQNAKINGLELVGNSRFGIFAIYTGEDGRSGFENIPNPSTNAKVKFTQYAFLYEFFDKTRLPNKIIEKSIKIGSFLPLSANLDRGVEIVMHNDDLGRVLQGIHVDVKQKTKSLELKEGVFNDAVHIEHGSFCGFRPRLRQVSASIPDEEKQLTKNDYTVLIKGINSITLRLPSVKDIEHGQRIEIRACNSVNNKILTDAPNGLSDSSRIEYNQMKIYIYDGITQIWWVNTLN